MLCRAIILQYSDQQDKKFHQGAADVNGDNNFLRFGYPFIGHRLDGGTKCQDFSGTLEMFVILVEYISKVLLVQL